MIKNIIQIGPYSAIGGVGIHIKRLEALISESFDVNIIDETSLDEADDKIFNIRNKKLFKYLNFIINAKIVHIHSGVWWLQIFHIIIAKLFIKKTVITIHSWKLNNPWKRYITSYFIKKTDIIITVSDQVSRDLKLKRYKLIPAFLPPVFSVEKRLPENLDEVLKSEKIIISSNASRLVTYNNQDLYGLDMCINLAEKIKINKKPYLIIFIIASLINGKKLYNNYKQIIFEKKLHDQIYLHLGSISFINLIKQSDIIIRPTNTDGDAVTIREAIYLEKPVIASDVVVRPKGTVLFKNRDVDDLYSKIENVIKNRYNIESIKNKNINYYKNIYISIYNSCINYKKF